MKTEREKFSLIIGTHLLDVLVEDLLQPLDNNRVEVIVPQEGGVGQLVEPRVVSAVVAFSLLLIKEETLSLGRDDSLHDSLQMTLSLLGTKNKMNV